MQQVQVISVEAAGYFSNEHISGSTVKVTLQRGADYAVCDGIVLWEEDDVGDDLFDEWVANAKAGEQGYNAVIVEGNETVLYGE